MTSSFLSDYQPKDFGIDGFPEYREVQCEAVEFVHESDKRFKACALPQGGGKSLFAVTLAKILGLRTVILTSTLGLQTQYVKEHERNGLVDIRGRTNYQCVDKSYTNDAGKSEPMNCLDGSMAGCSMTKGNGCTYEVKKAIARNKDIVGTSYAYWMAVNDQANGLERNESEADMEGENPPELLILDEGHDAHDKLGSYISCKIYEKDVAKLFSDHPRSERLEDWSEFAKAVMTDLKAEIRTLEMELIHLGRRVDKRAIDHVHKLQALQSKLDRLQKARPQDWIVEQQDGGKWGRSWNFDSIFPGMYAEHFLFCGVPNVVVMSATLKRKTMNLLGLKNDQFDFKAWRRIFPAHRNPIYLVGPTHRTKEGKVSMLRIDRKTPPADLRDWVKWHDDEIIGPRLDRKGIIQTVSYDRAKLFLDNSEYSKYMIGNTSDPDSASATEKADEFRKGKEPLVLVSPSFSTGWDFPLKQCEYIILPKVPFESLSKIQKARSERDPAYSDFKASQVTEQACFRGMRLPDDQCEVFLTDGHFEWFLYKNKGLMQDWFVPSVRRMIKVPKPLKRL